MKDIYVYDNSNVLKNKLGIQDESLFKDAEADYVSFRLKAVAKTPLAGNYDFAHLLRMHYYIFQDLFEWAGQPRVLNIYKEEPVLGGLSIDYSEYKNIESDAESVLGNMRTTQWRNLDIHQSAVVFSDVLAKLWKVHPFREGNTRTTITFCCQFADEIGLTPNRSLFEDNAHYVRTALVAYNAIFDDIGDRSKPEYLIRIVEDSFKH